MLTLNKEDRVKKQIIQTNRAPKAIGPYSQGVRVGNFLFTAGQIPIHPETGEVVEGEIQKQTTRVLENLKGVVEEAGGKLEDMIKTTVFLTDLKDFGAMNEVYGRYFPNEP